MDQSKHLTGALDKQIGGSHYKKGIQPFHLSFANCHDGCTHAMIKYMTRHRRNEPEKGYEDCCKAHHITGIRLDLIDLIGLPGLAQVPRVKINDYVASNELAVEDAACVYAIESWHEKTHVNHQTWHYHIRKLIRTAALAAYPTLYKEEDFV